MFTVSAECKNNTVQNIEKANSKFYQAQVKTHKINNAVFSDIFAGLTDEELLALQSLGEKEINKIKTGFSLLDVIKTAFGK